MDKDHDQQRKKLWCDVYVAFVRADNSTSDKHAPIWADRAVEEFDRRFPVSQSQTPQPR